MVRRRCTFILVVDAGCDPNYEFEDLGNAVRKIEIDLGVRIRFDELECLEPRLKTDAKSGARPYSAKGVIDYPLLTPAESKAPFSTSSLVITAPRVRASERMRLPMQIFHMRVRAISGSANRSSKAIDRWASKLWTGFSPEA